LRREAGRADVGAGRGLHLQPDHPPRPPRPERPADDADSSRRMVPAGRRRTRGAVDRVPRAWVRAVNEIETIAMLTEQLAAANGQKPNLGRFATTYAAAGMFIFPVNPQ